MSVETWGNMPKSQVDDEKPEEAVARLIDVHNDDPDSHLEVGQALQSHKASDIIDHLAESVVNDKLKYIIRPYNAVVASSGGDYTDIQDAIDYVSGEGGGDILLAPGTYTLAADLVLRDSVSLIGFGPYFSLINCNGYQIVTSMSIDEEDERWEEDTSNIDIKDIGIYGGAHQMVYAQGTIKFSGCRFYGASGTLVYDLGGGNKFENCAFSQTLTWFNTNKDNDYYGIDGTDGVDTYINNCRIVNIPKAISVGEDAIVSDNSISTCKYGVITNYPGPTISGNNINDAVGYGVYINHNLAIVNGNFIQGDETINEYSTGDGVYINGGDNCVITSNRIYKFQYGVRLVSGSDRNLVQVNVLNGNEDGATTDAGTNNSIANNITS